MMFGMVARSLAQGALKVPIGPVKTDDTIAAILTKHYLENDRHGCLEVVAKSLAQGEC